MIADTLNLRTHILDRPRRARPNSSESKRKKDKQDSATATVTSPCPPGSARRRIADVMITGPSGWRPRHSRAWQPCHVACREMMRHVVVQPRVDGTGTESTCSREHIAKRIHAGASPYPNPLSATNTLLNANNQPMPSVASNRPVKKLARNSCKRFPKKPPDGILLQSESIADRRPCHSNQRIRQPRTDRSQCRR